jgi:small-conductance mechanosensitive channel
MRMLGVVLVAALFVLAPQVCAQQQAPLVGIDPVRASLDQIETATRRDSHNLRALLDLSQSLTPLRDDLRAKLADLEPRLAEVGMRLQGLGPAPARDAAPENAAVAAERARLTQLRDELDAAVKQVRLLQVRADQLAQFISDRRRAAYAETLFERSSSVLDPFFWRDVAVELPAGNAAAIAVITSGWTHAVDNGGALRFAAALLALGIFAAGMIALARWWRQWLAARADGEHRFGAALASLLVFLRAAFAMPLIVMVVGEVLDQFGLLSKPLGEIVTGLSAGAVFASVGRATALAVLAPDEPQRRLVNLHDTTARALSRHLVWGSRALGAVVFVLSAQKVIGGSQVLATAVSMLFSAAVLGLLIHLLLDLRPSEEEFGDAVRRRTLWIRPIAWIAVAAIAVALLAGYAGFATFVAGRTIFTVTLLGVLYLLLAASDRLIGEMLTPGAARSRAIAANLGVDPRRLGLIGTVLSGVIRTLFVLLALALMIGPWEIAAADLLETMRLATFGIKIGDISISFGAVLGAVVVFTVVIVVTRIVQRWLETRLLPSTEIEPSLQLSISTVFGYVGFIIALVMALAEIGIDPQKIALVAGALSVGIGFGLQSIVSNFVSGLILLAERPIRVGDQIVVKNEEGYVRRISVRATEIETFDKASVIIPNSELITGLVKNWTHSNTLGRVNIKIAVSYDCDPDAVMAILKACVGEHASVLKEPPPAVLLTEFGASALVFEMFFIVPNLSDRGRIKSDIHIAILRQFRAAGIEMTPPQEVRLIGADLPAENAKSP